MNCPACATKLRSYLTKKGIAVDGCPACRGLFFDDGELPFFTPHPIKMRAVLADELRHSYPSRPCARCGETMETGGILNDNLKIDRCPKCKGIFLDEGELKDISQHFGVYVELDPIGTTNVAHPQATGPTKDDVTRDNVSPRFESKKSGRLASGIGAMGPLLQLPNLFTRSVFTLTLLYGLLGIILIALAETGVIVPGAALIIGLVVAFLQFVLSPWIMDLSLRFFYHARWIQYGELPEHLRQFVFQLCEDKKIKVPRFGIIEDGAPNAFTYGHTPNNARLVITRGILEMLDPEEARGVVAHEIGHIVHWDMVLMTVAQLVPLLLYYIYRTLIRMKSRGRDKSAGARLAIAIGAYILYIISEYIVLWFSRTREFHADRFAGEVLKNPNALARALIKIGYGLAASGTKRDENKKDEESASRPIAALGALGIFDQKSALSLAMVSTPGASLSTTGSSKPVEALDPTQVADSMKWDLWNPWARYYELHSTHPLIAHRIRYLSNQSQAMGLEPFMELNEQKPESYWDDFLLELGISVLPTIVFLFFVGLAFATNFASFFGIGLSLFGMASFVKILFSYRSGEGFPKMTIAGLLGHVKVSKVRPIPVTVEGEVIGKGVPGLIWSDDFIIRDQTGILFLDYRQPLAIWNWLFGFFKASQFQGKKLVGKGWFRRAPVPYLELFEFTVEGNTRRLWTSTAKKWFALLMIIGGVLLTAAFWMNGSIY